MFVISYSCEKPNYTQIVFTLLLNPKPIAYTLIIS